MEAFLKFWDLFVHFKNVLKIEAKLGSGPKGFVVADVGRVLCHKHISSASYDVDIPSSSDKNY